MSLLPFLSMQGEVSSFFQASVCEINGKKTKKKTTNLKALFSFGHTNPCYSKELWTWNPVFPKTFFSLLSHHLFFEISYSVFVQVLEREGEKTKHELTLLLHGGWCVSWPWSLIIQHYFLEPTDWQSLQYTGFQEPQIPQQLHQVHQVDDSEAYC